MGEAILSNRGMANNNSGGNEDTSNKALIQVTTMIGANVTCSKGTESYDKSSISGTVEFYVTIGTWTIKTTYGDQIKTDNVIVNSIKTYTVNHKGHKYGISIDMNITDPSNSVTYTDDAVGFEPFTDSSDYGNWKEIISNSFGVKPCILLNGSVVSYLNPDNYNYTVNNDPVDLTCSDNDNNIMVEFKKCWYKYSKSGNTLKFQVADYDCSSEGFSTLAFKSVDGSGITRDYMYIGVYPGSEDENKKIRSKRITYVYNDFDYSYSIISSMCKKNGSRYAMRDFVRECYITGLLMLIYKKRYGFFVPTSTSRPDMSQYGLFGSTVGGSKYLGCENLWINNIGSQEFIDGIFSNTDSTILIKDGAPYTIDSCTEISNSLTKDKKLHITSMQPALNGAVIIPSVGSTSSIGTFGQSYISSSYYKLCVAGEGPNSFYISASRFYESEYTYYGTRLIYC